VKNFEFCIYLQFRLLYCILKKKKMIKEKKLLWLCFVGEYIIIICNNFCKRHILSSLYQSMFFLLLYCNNNINNLLYCTPLYYLFFLFCISFFIVLGIGAEREMIASLYETRNQSTRLDFFFRKKVLFHYYDEKWKEFVKERKDRRWTRIDQRAE
jgi:hypothetical protein